MATAVVLIGAAPLLTYAAPLSALTTTSPLAPPIIPTLGGLADNLINNKQHLATSPPLTLQRQEHQLQSLLKKRSPDQIKYMNSRTGFTLHIWPNGTVNGVETTSNSSTSKYAMLEFITTMVTWMSSIYRTTPRSKRDNPRVEIRGVESRMWLCMNHTGQLYGSMHKTSECEFYEEVDRQAGSWNTYYSVQHPNNTEKSVKWYIALNKRGRPRSAMTTKHRSSRFMTQGIHAQGGSIVPPIDVVPAHKRKGGKKRYTRPDSAGNGKSEPIRLRQGEDKQKRDQLSNILDSIETMLSKASPKSGGSENVDFRESMLIDLGDSNPFELFDDNPIRHKSSKSKRRKSSRYRRIQR